MGSEKNLLSIVILTYNSHHYLKRLISYYDLKQIKYNIIIVDSSCEEIQLLNQQFIKKSGLVCKHMRFKEIVHPYLKIQKALQTIKTSYSLLLANDDFILPNSIEQCVAFLDNNSDHVAAYGTYYSFTHKDKESNPSFFLRNGISGHRSIAESNPAERLKNILLDYSTLFYSVIKTDVLYSIFCEMSDHVRNYKFGEFFLNGMVALRGKIKFLPFPYCFRELIDRSAGTTLDNDWLTRNDFDTCLSIFKRRLASKLSSLGNMQSKDAFFKVEVIVDKFINNQRAIAGLPSKISPPIVYPKIKVLLEQILPNKLFKFIIEIKRTHHKKLELKVDNEARGKCGIHLLKDGDDEYYKELELIKIFIKESEIFCSSIKRSRSLLEI